MPDTTKRAQRTPRPRAYKQHGEFLRAPNRDDPHGHVLSLLGEEWRVIHAFPPRRFPALPRNVAATYTREFHEIVIAPDEEFYTYLIHEVLEFLLGQFGCRYENFDDDVQFIMTHTQLDVLAKQLAGALTSLRSAQRATQKGGAK